MAGDDKPIETIDAAAWETCLRVLHAAIERPAAMPNLEVIERLAARIYKRARKERRKTSVIERREHDRERVEELLDARALGRTLDVDAGDSVPLQADARRCYICAALYRELHRRYHLLCPPCAAFHEAKRAVRLDLQGRRALITGARVNIGHATALRMLRDGAEVIATSRFAPATLHAFEQTSDFPSWGDRLHVVAADFRDPYEAERLATHVHDRFGSLDILVNNAAQTVVRLEDEGLARGDVNVAAVVDHREANGWTFHLEHVPTHELIDALHVNAAAPYLLTARLLPTLRASRFPDRYIVNVVGLDALLDRPTKLARHPHVNAGKAALNMLTRTSSEELSRQGIYMNSVDAGWVTHEGAWSVRANARARGFAPPLDADDAAARIYDPVKRGFDGEPVFGRVWKNFHETSW